LACRPGEPTTRRSAGQSALAGLAYRLSG